MAGNVKEWCSNATEDGARYILGGATDDPPYMYGHIVFEEPFTRNANHGFRCARYAEPPGEELLSAVSPASGFGSSSPVADELFETYINLYDFDRVDVKAKVETVDESSPHWRKERVSYEAAYGDERIPALVFLPRNAEPPFSDRRVVPGNRRLRVALKREPGLHLPLRLHSSKRASPRLPYLPGDVRALRAFLAGVLEAAGRDRPLVQGARAHVGILGDSRRCRQRKDRLLRFSSGASFGPLFTAIHPRFKASVLLAGGLWPPNARPEMDVVNFAPRSRVPTLMINGRGDLRLPYELFQLPLFRLLGGPDADKRHARLEGGHIPSNRNEIIRETLDWLDRYLGPVTVK